MSAANSSRPSAITAHRLNMVFGKGESQVKALDEVSLRIPSGEWTSIMGQSGSGKTTLLQCLSGLSSPTSGTVRIGNTALSQLSENRRAKLRRSKIGMVFQDFNLVPVLSVRDNITLPIRLAHQRLDKKWFKEITEVLEIGDRLRHLPHQLSGGQRQRAAIARAIIARPEVLFADEPTGSLDSTNSDRVIGLFRQLVREYGQTLVFVTHDQRAALSGDHLITMHDGKVQSSQGFAQ